ncbi:DUF1344 domain-containing protein [Mesorhizobium sp. CAU 1732]|uniref:DUF1344 domain-containing protein n=1 Tax=Mesorhizobium sp. CAU 1732 TaxID=3140358 RepID=UPI003260A279
MSAHGLARRAFLPVAAFVLFGFAANPMAGTVSKLDAQDHVLTMTDGTEYALRPDTPLPDVRPGDQVLVVWGMFHGKLALDHLVVCRTDAECRQ